MLKGKTLQELALSLEHLDANKRDVVVPLTKLTINDNASLRIDGDTQDLSPNNWAHSQLSDYTEIPKKYYETLREEAPQLLAQNMRHGLARIMDKKPSEARLIRTIDGKARAVLSSRYRILDSSDMLRTVLPVMLDKGMQVLSAELTEKRVYIKAIAPKIESEVKRGDVVQYGIIVSSSDVGGGAVNVSPMIYRLVCLNGMISPDSTVKQYHIGKNLAEENVRELLTNETKEKEDEAFWLKVRDVTLSSMKSEIFESVVDRLRIAENLPVKNTDINRVVELTNKALKLSLTQEISQLVANEFYQGDKTQWGLVNAYTAAAHKAPGIDYETSTLMEKAGGHILDLPKEAWRNISSVTV